MNRSVKIYLVLLALVMIGITAIELSKPKPINWDKTFNETQKIPYGTYILHNQLKTLFPKSKIKNIRVTPFEYFDKFYDRKDSTYKTSGTYIQISEYKDIDELSAQELLYFASHGNDIFLSTNNIPKKLLDSLKISITNKLNFKGKATLRLANSAFKNNPLVIETNLSNYFFSKLDSATTTVLGYQKFDNIERVNYIKVNYKQGNFYIHLQPIMFTNYQLLKNNNQKYAASVLSYLNDDTIHFDSKAKIGANLGDSPLRFILSQPPLRWAWYLGIITLILFIIFNAKRKQRIVNVINPLENTTIAFTKTIGNLYYETKDHKSVIEKKITYFLEHIRRDYYLDTQLLDDKFIKNLSLKSNKSADDIKKIIDLILNLKAKNNFDKTDLLNLNKAIEAFYNI